MILRSLNRIPKRSVVHFLSTRISLKCLLSSNLNYTYNRPSSIYPNKDNFRYHKNQAFLFSTRSTQSDPMTKDEIPEVIELTLPQFHDDMEAGKLLCWHKKLGDEVSEGDTLADIETHLAVIEYTSPKDGYLAGLIHMPSDENLIEVGDEIALLVRNKKDVAKAVSAYKDGLIEIEKFKTHNKNKH
jgi:hypothetical protein